MVAQSIVAPMTAPWQALNAMSQLVRIFNTFRRTRPARQRQSLSLRTAAVGQLRWRS